MFRGAILCPRDGIGLKHDGLLALVILKDGIRFHGWRLTVESVGIGIDRDHVRPKRNPNLRVPCA